MSQQPTNWAGNVTFHARTIHQPASVEELREVVARGSRLRPLGSAHSFNDIADTSGDLVSLARLPREVELDTARARARVGAGMRYAQVSRHLHAKGYALHNLGSLPHISVAGSCATATHGSGDANGNLATAVSAMELVTAEGDLITLERDTDGDRFDGAVVNLGALGVMVSLTLELVPAFEMRQYVYDGLALEALEDHFEAIVSHAYSVSLFTDWREPRINQVWLKHRATGTDQAPEPEWFGARLADSPRNPVPGMPEANCTQQMGVAGPWFERLPHFRPDFTPSSGEELQAEYLVPRRHALEALRAISGIRDRVAPVLQIAEIRTIAADRLWLSPSYGQDVVGLHFTWIKDAAAVRPVLALLEERLAPLGARPHWGKLFTTPPQLLHGLYERLADFRALVGDYDPKGKFGNDFTRRLLAEE